jgi:hypothetical protein
VGRVHFNSPQLGLFPTCGDDRFALLPALELIASGVLQFSEVVRTEVGQGVPLNRLLKFPSFF